MCDKRILAFELSLDINITMPPSMLTFFNLYGRIQYTITKEISMGAVYKVTNTVTRKVYIGMTSGRVNRRAQFHYNTTFNTDYNHPFYNSIRKYGWDAFEWETLYKSNNRQRLFDQEEVFIEQYQSTDRDHGYNLMQATRDSLYFPDNRRPIICISSGTIFESIIACADVFEVSPQLIINRILSQPQRASLYGEIEFDYYEPGKKYPRPLMTLEEALSKRYPVKKTPPKKHRVGYRYMDLKTGNEYRQVSEIARAVGVSRAIADRALHGKYYQNDKFRIAPIGSNWGDPIILLYWDSIEKTFESRIDAAITLNVSISELENIDSKFFRL